MGRPLKNQSQEKPLKMLTLNFGNVVELHASMLTDQMTTQLDLYSELTLVDKNSVHDISDKNSLIYESTRSFRERLEMIH